MKYFIKWDLGYGENFDVVDADNQDDAEVVAYDMWREDAESSANYSASPMNARLAQEYGLDWAEDD